MNYREQVNALLDKQDTKGVSKYGQPLEQSDAEIGERLSHLAEELTDGLRYVLWVKDELSSRMCFDAYQQLAERTAGENKTGKERYTNFSMGLSGETGEVVDYLKKVVFHGHDLDKEKLRSELGDCQWYLATIANTAGIKLSEVARKNIEKLQARYPDGFSEERSRNRTEGASTASDTRRCEDCRDYLTPSDTQWCISCCENNKVNWQPKLPPYHCDNCINELTEKCNKCILDGSNANAKPTRWQLKEGGSNG